MGCGPSTQRTAPAVEDVRQGATPVREEGSKGRAPVRRIRLRRLRCRGSLLLCNLWHRRPHQLPRAIDAALATHHLVICHHRAGWQVHGWSGAGCGGASCAPCPPAPGCWGSRTQWWRAARCPGLLPPAGPPAPHRPGLQAPPGQARAGASAGPRARPAPTGCAQQACCMQAVGGLAGASCGTLSMSRESRPAPMSGVAAVKPGTGSSWTVPR